MELKLDEQLLLADFRRLSPEGKKELLDYAAFLVKKFRPRTAEEQPTPGNQCRLDDQHEERPETAKEPLFTE
ncbi:MAG TPA: hypothetical protein VL949_07295 [Geobacteraceae bacterium]|jgi:hypothetical protein|nr:hypothetical protein [Geobacteraceae bacterium]